MINNGASMAHRIPLTARLTSERARPDRIRRARCAGWLAVGTVCFGAFMGQLDASIVTLTYAPLRAQFRTGSAAVQWVSLSYLLTLVVLLVPVGRLSDAHGRKLLYLYGFGVFTAASAACALAPTLGVLIALRVVQAAGAAMLQANSVALVTTSAPPGRTRAALGVQAAAQALGLALGPLVGGLLVAGLGWRSVFWVNVPVGVFALFAGHYLLPRTKAFTTVRAFDWPGLLLLALSGTALLLGLSAVSGLQIGVPAAAGLLVAAVAAGWAFTRRQVTSANPLIEVRVLRAPGIARGLAGAACGYLVLFGPLVAVPAILTGHAGQLRIGAVVTALPAGFAVAALADKAVPTVLSDARRALIGALIVAAALVGLLLVPLTQSPMAVLLFVLGVGLGVFTPANNTTVMASIPTRASGTGGGLINMARGLGTSLGVALVTLALHLGGGWLPGPRAAFAMLALAAAVMFAAALPGRGSRDALPGASSPGVGRGLPDQHRRTFEVESL